MKNEEPSDAEIISGLLLIIGFVVFAIYAFMSEGFAGLFAVGFFFWLIKPYL